MVSTTKLSTTFIVIFHFGTFHSCTLPLPLRPPAIPCTLCLLCVFCLPPRLGLRLNVHTGGGACSAPFRPFPTPHPFFPIRDPTTKLANLRGYQAYELKVLAGPAPPRPHAPLAVHALGWAQLICQLHMGSQTNIPHCACACVCVCVCVCFCVWACACACDCPCTQHHPPPAPSPTPVPVPITSAHAQPPIPGTTPIPAPVPIPIHPHPTAAAAC